MNAGCSGAVIKHFPHPLAFEGFWETVPMICAPLNSPTRINGPQPGLSRNCSPCCSFIAAIGYYSSNNLLLLRHLLRLGNDYCIAIISVFSPRFDYSDINAGNLGIGCLLGRFYNIFLFLTLAPHDYVIYCQARGLSGHTLPCVECALSHFGATPGDWLPARLVFYYFSTLDPGTT